MIEIRPNVTVSAWRVGETRSDLVQRVRVHNIIPSTGLDFARDLFGGLETRPDIIAVGSGTAAASASDTALSSQTFSKVISRRFPETAKMTFQMLMDQTEGNATTIAEIGLFRGTKLLARALISPTIAKTSAILVTVSHEFTFSIG